VNVKFILNLCNEISVNFLALSGRGDEAKKACRVKKLYWFLTAVLVDFAV